MYLKVKQGNDITKTCFVLFVSVENPVLCWSASGFSFYNSFHWFFVHLVKTGIK